MNLTPVLTKRYDMTYSLQWLGTPEVLSAYPPHNIQTIQTTQPITGIKTIDSYEVITEGNNANQYLKIFFKYKNCKKGCDWSAQQPIENITGLTLKDVCPLELQFIIYYVNDAGTNPSNIYLKRLTIDGTFVYQTTDSAAFLTPDNNEIVITPKEIYKVFSLSDFQLLSKSGKGSNYTIKYRVTQDGGRSYTNWEPLTSNNLKTLRLDDLRFAQFQYLINLNGTKGYVYIYDIILIGDFQNVGANYLKTNRYGIREDMITQFLSESTALTTNANNPAANNLSPTNVSVGDVQSTSTGLAITGGLGFSCGSDAIDLGLSCYMTKNEVLNNLTTNQNKSNLFQPYKNSDQITQWGNMLINQLNNVLGWNCPYILTDPDGNGIDRVLHEYTLKNVVDMQTIKIMVPNNEFKDETQLINQFGLDLFDSFEVIITKDAFKNAFGITKRPGRDDIIFIAPANKLYRVKHAQAQRQIMNAALYYKVILQKYEDRPDIKFEDQTAEDFINSLTNNTTVEELLGPDIINEEKKVANKKQTFSTSFDFVRESIAKGVETIHETVYNGNMDVITNYYDFNKAVKGQYAINYTALDQSIDSSINRSFIIWNNINSGYDPNKPLLKSVFDNYYLSDKDSYSLISNFSDDVSQGYRINVEKQGVIFQYNNKTYSVPFQPMKGVWYAYLWNLDQRQQKLTGYVYRRNVDIYITLFNRNTYEKIQLVTPDTLEDAYKLDDPNYTYQDAKNDGFEPVENIEETIRSSSSNKFLLLATQEFDITPEGFTNTATLQIMASNSKLSNVRIFYDVLHPDTHHNILNQNIVTDAQYLLLADNANKKLITTNYWTKNFR